MQSYKNDELLKTIQDSPISELFKAIEKDPEIKDATHHVIGKLPKVNNIVTINGLKFKVIHADNLGRINLKILENDRL